MRNCKLATEGTQNSKLCGESHTQREVPMNKSCLQHYRLICDGCGDHPRNQDLCTSSLQAVTGLTEVCVLPMWVQRHLAGPQLGPNGGLIAHCSLSSTGPVVPPAIWMLLPLCLSHTLQLWDEGESAKEIKIDEIKVWGEGTGRGRKNVHTVIISRFDPDYKNKVLIIWDEPRAIRGLTFKTQFKANKGALSFITVN